MIDATSARRFPARDLAVPNPLSAYLSRISRGALLTHREEVELGRRVRAGDRIARRTLIERNLRLVVSVAVRYRRSGVPLEDLIQEDNIGLMEAVERFDPERGYRFSSYPEWRIRKAIQKAAAAQSRTVRVPRRTRDRMEALGQAHGELRAELGREPDAEESASRLGWTIAEVRATMGVAAAARSWISRTAPRKTLPPWPSSWRTRAHPRYRTRWCGGWNWTGYGGSWRHCRSAPTTSSCAATAWSGESRQGWRSSRQN